MKYLIINSVCGIGSTGKICGAIAEAYHRDGHKVKIAYGRDDTVPEQYRQFAVPIGSAWDVKLHGIATRLLDNHGFSSRAATRHFLQWADQYNPDVLWLHNLHGYYINIKQLFCWIKSRPHMQVKWTLHDCWAFTGHCSHFSFVGCDKWKTQCHHCPQKHQYPASVFLDNSRRNYKNKRKLFTGVPNMTLITPSYWLADLVGQSFLKDYPIQVCYNTIDTTIFKPTPSDFKQQYHIADKKVILGVASNWDSRKGLDDFISLAAMIDDSWRIVLVGLRPEQCGNLPNNMIAISRTHDQAELARIYSAADVFVNPSYEETFGLTTVEAKACGVPVIVYKNTACEEIVSKQGGFAVPAGAKHIYHQLCHLTEHP